MSEAQTDATQAAMDEVKAGAEVAPLDHTDQARHEEGDGTEARAKPTAVAPVDAPAAVDGEAGSAEAGSGETESDDEEGSEGDEDENPLETEAEIAADYLEELLDIADLDGDIDTYIEGDRAHVSVVSESTALVGDKGEVLDALQELARLAVMTETGERSRLMLDVAGYRDKRRTELVALAGDAVSEANSTHERVPLTPMNPFERKIVHDAVAAAGLSSESEGEEPRRRVVVLPA